MCCYNGLYYDRYACKCSVCVCEFFSPLNLNPHPPVTLSQHQCTLISFRGAIRLFACTHFSSRILGVFFFYTLPPLVSAVFRRQPDGFYSKRSAR